MPSHTSSYKKVQGIHFLHLKGSTTERARQHGALLKDTIRNGVVPILSQRNQWMIRRGPGVVRNKWVHGPVVWAYEHLFLRWLERHLPEEQKQIICALSDETGIPERDFYNGIFQPDGLMMIAKLTVMKHVLPESRSWRAFGCSSSVVPPEWSQNGRILASRNLDYPIVGPWEGNTTVLFHEPTEKNTIPHIAVVSAGVHTSGLTSMNKEGLSLAIHAHFSRRVSTTGVPGTVIGDAIISKATNLNEAIDIARRHSPTMNWAFVITSAKDKAGVVIECTPERVAVRHAEGNLLTHTNYFQTQELNESEALVCGMEAEDVQGRNCKMRESLESQKGEITPAVLCQLLGDHSDYRTGVERVVGNPISVVTTVKSVVFEPEDLHFWISSRPESPTGLDSEFVGVSLDRFWDSNYVPKTLPGYQPKSSTLVEATREFRKAYRAWHIENQKEDFEETAYRSAKKAAEIHPIDGHLWLISGILAFKMQKFPEAMAAFQEAKSRQISTHARDICLLFLARGHDIQGERDKAKEFYAHYKSAEEPRIRAALRKGLWFAYKAKDASNLVLDLQFPDALQY